MDISELVDRILEAVLDAPARCDDPYIQERIIRSEVWNLVEDWEKELHADWRANIIISPPEVEE